MTLTVEKIHLILLGERESDIPWSMGEILQAKKSPQAIFESLRNIRFSDGSDAWLFWDRDLGIPEPKTVRAVLSLPGDVWHAGLRLGLNGLPGLINFVHPTWMLNRDPDPDKVATSWRLSLRACLVRGAVLRKLGSVCPDFQSLEGASLEMGHRYVMNGVIIRHVPWLVSEEIRLDTSKLPFSDEWLFILRRMGRRWTRWALARALLTEYVTPSKVFHAALKLRETVVQDESSIFPQQVPSVKSDFSNTRVSVLIPTLDRYDYLRRLLPQLRNQTVPPFEIILVDQTPLSRRITTLADEFRDLPLKILFRDHPGQCSARNEGLKIAHGDYILFLDDDDEVPPDLIEAHLGSLGHFRALVSSGVANDVSGMPLPEHFRHVGCSDVFPTNNTLIRRNILESSGLFDLAHDGGERDDGDLGMRVYLSGTLMILNPTIRVLHHHAPIGGLRTHRARVVTYVSSRNSVIERQIISISEAYLCKRYFSPMQVTEKVWLTVFSTLSFHGSKTGKIAKFLIGLILLPHTVWRTRKNVQIADQMLESFPRIPYLTPAEEKT